MAGGHSNQNLRWTKKPWAAVQLLLGEEGKIYCVCIQYSSTHARSGGIGCSKKSGLDVLRAV